MPNAIGYIRVSHAEQVESGLSLEAQEQDCQRYWDRLLKPKEVAWAKLIADEAVSGSPQEMIYLGIGGSGRNHFLRVGTVDFVPQGRDDVDRVDGIDAGHDPVGSAKADGIPAATVSGGDGDQVLPRQSAVR